MADKPPLHEVIVFDVEDVIGRLRKLDLKGHGVSLREIQVASKLTTALTFLEESHVPDNAKTWMLPRLKGLVDETLDGLSWLVDYVSLRDALIKEFTEDVAKIESEAEVEEAPSEPEGDNSAE